MSRPCFVVIFRGDEIVEAAHNNPGGFRPTTEIPIGDYVVVHCVIGLLGPDYSRIGITEVEAQKVTIEQQVEFGDLCFLLTEKPKDGITVVPLSVDDLSPQQRRQTISAVQKKDHWWWVNATREVKMALQKGRI